MRKLLDQINTIYKKKFLLILFFTTLFSLLIFARVKFRSVFTTLVIIEEKENNIFASESSPVSDGIFDALWDRNECIFFDMKIDKPLMMADDQLDIKPFMGLARGSGADSILLIKLT